MSGNLESVGAVVDEVAAVGNDALLDIELEARIQFGSREMLLSELMELNAGDVVELDRLISDPVDLLVGDRIVARGEVVVVGGNFGQQVTEVVAPKPRLESVRCLL
ncbi:flagellar motor switch/type III secretory pathway protein [Terriglobus roseus DSM 18391]|uniref:Flagellar motor switch protein FliN n=1 Tax=Terriglobus roseus (strain DSM 18391 / NRRL B-41598 / KBS 63) TaxID=926566 RepID=I3ZFW9_TERRK|nr:FliM/FliN family flagellar motor switch protein [Terriglobus roseus]AFL88137.1 flagellar motor switch/type III secretory pathway protein [Terriglobus roseus DSM 18391]